ncbi:MAG: Holliday junction resolvase RuvX [Syntrophales bacterium]|nr:Holliday junction resolvase RuvX [Syntrophales bacterium]
MMRILGFDYGSRRMGVAICDELGITAQTLATITRRNRKQDMEEISGFIKKYDVEKIVVGYPLMLDGTEGIQCEKVNRFISILEAAFSLPVIRWDETMTTKEAEEILIRAKVPRKKMRSVVDKLTASLILQGYLNSLNP